MSVSKMTVAIVAGNNHEGTGPLAPTMPISWYIGRKAFSNITLFMLYVIQYYFLLHIILFISYRQTMFTKNINVRGCQKESR